MDRNIIREEIMNVLGLQGTTPPQTSGTTNQTPNQQSTTPRRNPQLTTVVNRARQLISMNTSPMAETAASNTFQYPKRRRIGHGYAKPPKQGENKTIELVCLLPGEDTNYSISKDDIFLTGAVTLNTQDTELELRRKILEVLVTRMSSLQLHEFQFVKVLRKTVTLPAVKDGQEYNYALIKTFMGQGKLYTRLTKAPENTQEIDNQGIDNTVADKDEKPNEGFGALSMVERLKLIFPLEPPQKLVEASRGCATIDEAINALLDAKG